MNLQHKIIREILRGMGKPEAQQILQTYLPGNEWQSIYYADVEQENLNFIGDKRLHCSESMVKKYRRYGYEKLAVSFYAKIK